MKLIRIGKNSQSCQIVINNPRVSNKHAEIHILDDGKLLIKDTNSLNGTTVNGRALKPDVETTIQRGDKVVFADEEVLNWAQVPQPANLTAFKQVVNIGSNFRNDIVVNSNTVSSYHAQLRVAKNGTVYIRDNGSVNGTKVNGMKIAPNIDRKLKSSDKVMCSSEDITFRIKPFFKGTSTVKWIGLSAASVAAVAALALLVWWIWPPHKPDRTAVVYVNTIYHPVVKFTNNPIPKEYWNGEMEITGENNMVISQATAFFIDREGRMATNRHVAAPWEELNSDDEVKIRMAIENFLPKTNNVEDIVEFLSNSPFGAKILKYANEKTNDPAEFSSYLINLSKALGKSPYEIKGTIDNIVVGYAGRYYTNIDEFQRCNVVKVSADKDVDLAILQLNTKKTPDEVKFVFDMNNVYSEKLEPLADRLYTIGYPAGLTWSLDDKQKSLEPSSRETKCSKVPSKYSFELQETSVGGSSGSPVYNKKGQLVGILFGGYSIAGGASKAVHAKFLKRMYDEEVNM